VAHVLPGKLLLPYVESTTIIWPPMNYTPHGQSTCGVCRVSCVVCVCVCVCVSYVCVCRVCRVSCVTESTRSGRVSTASAVAVSGSIQGTSLTSASSASVTCYRQSQSRPTTTTERWTNLTQRAWRCRGRPPWPAATRWRLYRPTAIRCLSPRRSPTKLNTPVLVVCAGAAVRRRWCVCRVSCVVCRVPCVVCVIG
jgi:hypothetical protein